MTATAREDGREVEAAATTAAGEVEVEERHYQGEQN